MALRPKVDPLHRTVQPSALHVRGGPGGDFFDQPFDAGLLVVPIFGQKLCDIDFTVDPFHRLIDVKRVGLGDLDILAARNVGSVARDERVEVVRENAVERAEI